MTDHKWADLIIQRARDDDAALVVDAINKLVASRRANNGSVILACAQVLAQTIVNAPPGDAKEVREGIIGLIDDFAMRLAMEAP